MTCMSGIDLGGWSVNAEAAGTTGWKWCSRMGDSGTGPLKGTESWGPAAKWQRRTWGLFGNAALEMEDGEKGEDGEEGDVGVGGTEAEGGCAASWQGVEGSDLAADAGSEVPGSGFDSVACRGFGTTLGLVGNVCVLLRAAGGGSLLGASELGVDMRGPVRFGAGSGDGQGLVLGDWGRSGDWGGTQNFLTGWSGGTQCEDARHNAAKAGAHAGRQAHR